MHTLFTPLAALTLFVIARAGDLAIGIALPRTLRIVLYGLVALIALVAFILLFTGTGG